MNDIKRYAIDGTCTANGQISVFDYESDAGRYVRYQDHIKAMEAMKSKIKDYKAGAENWQANAESWRDEFHEQREAIVQQSREIEKLKSALSDVVKWNCPDYEIPDNLESRWNQIRELTK